MFVGGTQRNLRFQYNELFYNSICYDEYRRYDFFRHDAEFIASTFNLINKTVLVVGCAYGYLVDELRKQGIKSFGVDNSVYARSRINRVFELEPDKKVLEGDTSKSTVWTGIKTQIGTIDFLITEDLFTDFEDSQISPFLSLCRNHSSRRLHILTCAPERPIQNRDHHFNWKSFAEWDSILKPDALLNRELSDRRFIKYGLS